MCESKLKVAIDQLIQAYQPRRIILFGMCTRRAVGMRT